MDFGKSQNGFWKKSKMILDFGKTVKMILEKQLK